MSTSKGFPTAETNENIASFPKTFGGKKGKEIQAITIVVFSYGLNKGSHFQVLIGYDQLFWVM